MHNRKELASKEQLFLKRQLFEGDLQQYQQVPQEMKRQLSEQQAKQLKLFERSKISLSRFVADVQNDKLENSLNFQEQIQFIPCPFCAVPLMLNQLEHIGACQEGTQCYYCKQKYPKFVYGSHLLVCHKRIQRSQKQKQKKESQHKKVQNLSSAANKKPNQIYANYKKIKKQQEQKPKLSQKGKQQHKQVKVEKKQFEQEKKQPIKRIFQRQKSPILSPRIKTEIKANDKITTKINKKRQVSNNIFPNNKKSYQIPKKAYQYDKESKIRKQQYKGLQQYEIDQILIEQYKSRGEQSQCSICTMDISNNQQIIRLACSHFFHADCLKPWLLSRSRCPVCKAMIQL